MGAKSDEVKDGPKATRGLTETRYIFVFMAFLGTVIAIADRIALNVAIVGMVDRCKPWFNNQRLDLIRTNIPFSAGDIGYSSEIGNECGAGNGTVLPEVLMIRYYISGCGMILPI